MQAGDMEGKSEKMTQQEGGNDRVKRLSAPVKRSLFKCHLLRSYFVAYLRIGFCLMI